MSINSTKGENKSVKKIDIIGFWRVYGKPQMFPNRLWSAYLFLMRWQSNLDRDIWNKFWGAPRKGNWPL